MARFLVRRVLGILVILFAVSVITFVIFFMVPKLLGSNPAASFAGRSPDAATLEAVTKKLGLDKPLPVQYGSYVKAIFVGRDFESGGDVDRCPAPCLGYSFKNNQPVWELILSRLPVTASLALVAAVMWLVLGVAAGVVSALKKGTMLDRTVMTMALAGVSMPIYFTGLMFLAFVSYKWGLLPNVHYVPLTESPVQWLRNLLLPCFALALLYAALYARLTRGSMLETMGEDYVRTARAKGLPERTVIGKHGLRAALTPIITIFGLDVGALLGGAILTEQTFGFAGIGKLSIIAIRDQDLPVLIGVTLFAAFFIAIMNLLVDLLYAVVDPRVRLG